MSIVECMKCKKTIAVYYTVPRKDKYVCDSCVKKSIDSQTVQEVEDE